VKLAGTAFYPSPWALRAQAELTWSSGLSPLGIWEGTLQVGGLYRLGLSRRVGLLVGLLGGMRCHYYHFDNDDQGVRFTWAASVPGELWLRSEGGYGVGAGLVAGLSGPAPTHELYGRPAWERSSSWWGLSLLFGATL
jgi:hypothetical protein